MTVERPVSHRRRALSLSPLWPAMATLSPRSSVAASPEATAPAAFAVQVAVDASQALHPANPLLVGSNTPWVYGSEGLMDEQGAYRPGMLELAKELAPTVLRYPSVADTHAWRQGIGPLASRQPVFAYPGQPFQKIVYGTQEFLETCEAVGAQPLFIVNMHDGTDASLAQQAADWVRHVNRTPQLSRRTGKPLPRAAYWELGNEPYLMEAKLPDGSPNRLLLRPELFARRANAVIAAMKAVDPGVRVGLPFALDTYSGRPWRPNGGELATVVGEQLGYADKLLAGLDRPQDLHFLALHYYMPLITGPTDAQGRPLLLPATDEALHWGAMAGSETIRRHLQLVPEFWSRHPRTARTPAPRLLVTEFNSFFTSGQAQGKELKQNAYVMTQAGALFAADLLRVLAMEPRVEAAMQWSLSGNWVFGAIAPPQGAAAARARPVYHVLRLFRRLLAGGQVVAVQVDAPVTQKAGTGVSFAAPYPAMPLATGLAVREGSELRCLVINKDPAQAADVVLALRGARAREAQAEVLQSRGLFHTPDTAEASVPTPAAVRLEADGSRAAWRLPPASCGLVRIKLR